jgi:hypothetical protein
MFDLFVGDVYKSLAIESKKHDPDSILVSKSNLTEFLTTPKGTVYSSLADIGDYSTFRDLCASAKNIYYRPPAVWSHNNQKIQTEEILIWLSQYKFVDGIDQLFNKSHLLNTDLLHSSRISSQKQLWITGCSVTNGTGVNLNESFKELVSTKLKLHYTDLSCYGSSIMWQSDQICRSDIQSEDLVFWGLTGQHRIPVFENNVVHLYGLIYEKNPEYKLKFPIDLLDNESLLYHNVLAVRRSYNFCKKIGAKLVILGLMPDPKNAWQYYNVPVFRQLTPLHYPECYVDLGFDNAHPGPKQHKIFAEEFLKFYSELYVD